MKIKNNELKEMVAIANTTKSDYSTAIEVKENELLVQFNANYLYSLKGEHSMELGSYYLSAMEFNKIIKSFTLKPYITTNSCRKQLPYFVLCHIIV